MPWQDAMHVPFAIELWRDLLKWAPECCSKCNVPRRSRCTQFLLTNYLTIQLANYPTTQLANY